MLSVIGSKKWFKSNCPNTGCTYLSLIQTETEDFSGKPTKAFGLGRKKISFLLQILVINLSSRPSVCYLLPFVWGLFCPIHPQTTL